MMADWCILRTSGRTTLRLAESLQEDGFEAWTPVETRTIRVPRANVRRKVILPIMPSYVFARSRDLLDLLELAAMPVKARRGVGPAHPSFNVMKHAESIPLIADRHLNGLRNIEAKRNPRKRAEPLIAGLAVKVKVEGGSFAGMKGVVRKSDHGHTLVCFDERLTVKIATSLLSQDELGMEPPCISHVRRAA